MTVSKLQFVLHGEAWKLERGDVEFIDSAGRRQAELRSVLKLSTQIWTSETLKVANPQPILLRMANARPIIFEYLQMESFLSDWYRYRKLHERQFSFQRWSEELSLTSRSYLRFMVLGKRRLSVDLTEKFVQNMKLVGDEAEYFRLLVQLGVATNPLAQQSVQSRLREIWRKQSQGFEIEDTQSLLADPACPIVFSFLTMVPAPFPLQRMAEALHLPVSQLRLCLETLQKLELVELTHLENGEVDFFLKEKMFKIKAEAHAPFIQAFHMLGLEQAKEAHALPFSERKYRSLVLSLSEEGKKKLEVLIDNFAREATAVLSEDQKATRVFRIGLQFFPVSE